MKKRNFRKLALLGIASGMLISQQQGLNAAVSTDELDHMLAKKEKNACGKNGCPNLTASRDKPSNPLADNFQAPDTKTDAKAAAKPDAKTDAKSKADADSDDEYDPNGSNLGYHLMTEDELLLEVNEEGAKMYNSLTPEGKKLALEVASMRCGKTNLCKGLNACKTDENDCAGKGSCKGKGKCAFSDKNLAVKVVFDKMSQKRAKALGK